MRDERERGDRKKNIIIKRVRGRKRKE